MIKKKRTRKFQTSWMQDRPWLFHDKEKDREIELLDSVTHVHGHKIIQPACGKTRNLEILFNAYIVSIKLH
jgi:hypothetical protein